MWERILTYEIQPEDAGRTVAEYLRSRGFSRHLLIRLKTMPDGITLDGVPVLPSHRFFFDRVKSLLTIRLREEEASEHIAPVPLPLTIVYEDENILLADKRQGLVCHADETGEFSAETMASLLRLTAWLCEEFDLAPADVIRHYDVTGKICPKYYVDHPEAWEDFRSALRAARTQENPS